jgi:predicted esterase
VFRTTAVALGCFAVAVACGDDGVETRALFEVPRAGAALTDFYALPFPNDIRVAADGRISLSDYVLPNDLVAEYVEAIAERQRGFSLSGAILFRFSGPIDVGSLPTNAAAATEPAASVYLVDVDAGSPERGRAIPLRLRFEELAGETIGPDWLGVVPYPGFVLREDTTYAAVVTRRVTAGGAPVGRSTDLAAIAAPEAPADPDLARAQQLYQPLWDWLDEAGGDERADVASAAVFTTQDATSLLARVREVIYADVSPPLARDVSLVREEGSLAWYDGVFDAPNFQTGLPPYSRSEDGGEIATDADGEPIVQRMEQLRFSFTVPLGVPPAAGWPLVIYAHGTGGDYHSFHDDGTAARLAERGLAAISIDQVLHGPRNPNGSPEVSFFNFQNPLSARDNTLQGALDDFSLLRLAASIDFTDPDSGRVIRFDPDRIMFFGHSQGGLTGTPFLAREPGIAGAVLSGAGGLLYLSLLYKTEPIDIAGLVAAILRDVPLDEFNPVLALIQTWMDRSDPASYARYLVVDPAGGAEPKHVFHSLGLTDRFTPVPAIEALAVALGVEPVEPIVQPIEGFEVADRTTRTAPVAGNVGGVTAVLLEYTERSGSDGHFVLFDVEAARRQSIQFLATLAETGEATLVAP